jgi:serine/threonine protein kinase
MTGMRDCPQVECWQALFADTVPPDQRESYESHLESCPACQERLDRAEEEGNALRKLARRLGDPTTAVADPTLEQFLGRLHEEKPPDRSAPAEPADLYFLRPPDRPGILGTLGAYEVREVIGQGGMGVVLKAFDPALHRLVAIKVLAPALAGSATARRRFTREAQAAAAVCHDHMVAVHGVSEADGLPYLVMQYVAGESLQERLDRVGPLPVEEVVRIGMQAASGLAAAHAQGLIHRDVKPANLLLENGLAKVKITDFGLARMVDDVPVTRDGVVLGTPEYMAPEQARGEQIDHRADLFGLGSVLYACCTGHPPFCGPTAVAVLRRVSDEQHPPVRALNPEVPAWLEALIARLLAKDLAQRFQSAAEVAALLEGYLAHLRQPTTVAAPELPPLPAAPGSRPAGEEKRPAPAPRLRGSRAWVLSLSALAAGLILMCTGLIVLEPLVLRPEPNKPQADRQPLPGNPVVVAAAANVDVWSVAVSQDGKTVAASAGMWDQPGEIGVWNLATREPLQHFSEELGVASVALSPDGKLLASGSWTGHVRIYDWAAGKQVFDLPVGDVARVAFAPDGRLLATATEDKSAQLWDVSTGKLVADLQGDLFRFHCVAFSPDGKRVLAGGGDWKPGGLNQVTVWDVASKQQVLKLTGHQNAILGISFSPDGKTIATASVDRTVRLWDADSGTPLKTLSGHAHWVESAVFAPDGKTVVSGGPDRTVRFWDVDQGQETRRMAMPGGVRTVRFTPDGTTLIVGGGPKTLKLFSAADQKELAALWNGSEPQPAAMDLLPVAPPPKPPGRGWLAAAGLLGLGLAFLVSLAFAVRMSLRRLPAGPAPSGAGAPAAPLSFVCPGCGKKLKVKAELAGKKVKCPQCGKPAQVPEAKAAPVPVSPARPWRRRAVALAAFATAGLSAALFLVVFWLSRSRPEPTVSPLQVPAARVRAQKIDTIDARRYASVTDKDLAVLPGLDNLRVLNLDNTEISDTGLKDVARARNLITLSLTNTQVTDAGLAELKPLTNLEDLRLDKLPITDAGLAHLTAFPRLRRLSLYKTAITDNGVAYLKQLPNLERLSLDETQTGDEALRHLSQCSNLRYVSVWQTQVTDAGVQELQKALPGLKVNR